MKYIDLFAGIGGFHLGMEQAGHKCVGWCEWDKFARQSYMAIHDNADKIWNAKDINGVKVNEIPQADCWCFGFPCQDISVAGKQKGINNGKRSSLFFTVTKFLRETPKERKPSYLFIENVKNLLSINKGWDFLQVQAELDEIGYDIEWSVIDSAQVVPQHRERVFIVGHLRGRRTRKVFPIIRENSTVVKPIKEIARLNEKRHASEGNSILDARGVSQTLSARGYKDPMKVAVHQIGNISTSKSFGGNPQAGRVYGTDGASPTLNTMQGGNRQPKIAVPVINDEGRKNKSLTFKKISPTLRSEAHGNLPKIVIPVADPDRVNKDQNGRRFKTNGEPEFTLTGQDRHGVLIKDVIGSMQKHVSVTDGSFSPSLTSAMGMGGGQIPMPVDSDLRIRKLTPKECWRLQGFPDWAFNRARKAGLSDSQLYKQAGNSVTVPVIKAIAERMELT